MVEFNPHRAATVAKATAAGREPPKRPPKPKFEPTVLTLQEVLTRSADRALSDKPPVQCTTGNYLLDRITGGFKADDVAIIGADTSIGKSCYVVAVSDENLLAGKRVLIVSREDSSERYGARLMCRRARCNAYRYRDHCLTLSEQEAVKRIAAKALPEPFYVDARGVEVDDVVAQIVWLVAEHGIDLVHVDYLQAFHSNKSHKDRAHEVHYCARTLIDGIKRSGAAGTLETQLTIESRTTRPNVHHIRDCKDPGMFCETALFIYELPTALKNRQNVAIAVAGTKAIHVDKVKDGERGKVLPLEWFKESASFLAQPKPLRVPDGYNFDEYDSPDGDL